VTLRHGSPLERFPEVEQAILFGSRAKAVHKPGSGIEFALIGTGFGRRVVGEIHDSLGDLLLPNRFSLGIPLFQRHAVPHRQKANALWNRSDFSGEVFGNKCQRFNTMTRQYD
jgi:hypothetical protein